MTAREFAVANLRDSDGLGVQGYTVRRTLEVEKPLAAVMFPYKKKTFIDDAIRDRKWVPDAKYDVIPSMKDKNTRSGMCKDMRHTIATDAQRFAKKTKGPDQGTYKPDFKLTEPRKLGCFKFKGSLDDTSFLAEPIFKGATQGKTYSPNFSLIEPRIKGRKLSKPINMKLDTTPQFLREKSATEKISPTSYNALDSFRRTQTDRLRFFMSKNNPKGEGELMAHRKKWVPGPGHYKLEDVSKGYKIISSSPTRSRRH